MKDINGLHDLNRIYTVFGAPTPAEKIIITECLYCGYEYGHKDSCDRKKHYNEFMDKMYTNPYFLSLPETEQQLYIRDLKKQYDVDD